MPKLNHFHYVVTFVLFLCFFSTSRDNNSIHSNDFIERVEPSLLEKISKLNIVYSGDLPSEFILPNFLSSSLFSAKIYDKNKRNIVLYSYFGDGTIRFFTISNTELQFIAKVPTQHTASKINILDIHKDGKDEIVFSEGSKILIIESYNMAVQGRVIQLSEFIYDISFGDIDNDAIPELIAFSTALNDKSKKNFITFNLSLWKFKDSTYTLLWNNKTEYTFNYYDRGGNCHLEKVTKGSKNSYYLNNIF